MNHRTLNWVHVHTVVSHITASLQLPALQYTHVHTYWVYHCHRTPTQVIHCNLTNTPNVNVNQRRTTQSLQETTMLPVPAEDRPQLYGLKHHFHNIVKIWMHCGAFWMQQMRVLWQNEWNTDVNIDVVVDPSGDVERLKPWDDWRCNHWHVMRWQVFVIVVELYTHRHLQPINQPTSASIIQSVRQSTNQSVNQLISPSISLSLYT